MGKLNRFFATNTTLAEGSFWCRCLPAPPSLPRFSSCPLCGAGSRSRSGVPAPRAAAALARRAGLCSAGPRAAGEGCWGSGSRESRHGSSRAYRNAVSSARQCLKTRQGRTARRCWLGGCSPRESAQGRSRAGPARSCGSALAQGALHTPWAGDVRGGILQGQRKGRRSRRKGLRGLELRCDSTAGEGTHGSPRTGTRGSALLSCSWAGTGTGFPLVLPVISTEHRLFIRNLVLFQSALNSVNRDQV